MPGAPLWGKNAENLLGQFFGESDSYFAVRIPVVNSNVDGRCHLVLLLSEFDVSLCEFPIDVEALTLEFA